MSEKYTPDDRITMPDAAKERIKRALGERGELKGIVTSRDPGMNDILYHLERDDLRPGVHQTQLPLILHGPDVTIFYTVMDPGAIVPLHQHERDLWRVVIAGCVILDDGRELRQGDWMFVPKGESYSLRACVNPGAIITHCYG